MLVLFLLMNLLFVGLGWPLYKRKIKPNSWYGLRVGETMENERVWYAANAYSGRVFKKRFAEDNRSSDNS